MSDEPGLSKYLKEAFNVRVPVPYLGEVPINWLFLGSAGIASFFFPPLALIAGGLELALMYTLSHNERFRNYVRGRQIMDARQGQRGNWASQRETLVSALEDASRNRYELLERRSHRARQTHAQHLGDEFDEFLEEGLQHLQLIYLRLLGTQEHLSRQVAQTENAQLAEELEEAKGRLTTLDVNEDSRILRSVQSTIQILNRRIANLHSAKKNVAFIDTELRRIEHQTELIIEEAALSNDPNDVARRIDAVTSTFDETQEWIKESKTLMKEVGFELNEERPMPPPQKTGIS